VNGGDRVKTEQTGELEENEEQPVEEAELDEGEETLTEEGEAATEEEGKETSEEEPLEAKEEGEKEKPSRREEEAEFVEERVYTIPLRRAWIMPPNKRAPRAVRIVKTFIQRHMKVGEGAIKEEGEEEGGKIIISNEVNEEIWRRGIEKPPRKLRIRAARDEEGNVTVFLA
jgi:large subunit ribosomal protein L31e